ncbi:MAG: hypothetical protein PF486_06035 [Prolixibacteraceae bacterium]|jgi:hypothetical protein|nr:hypothetical protein [Prolixibacteraceae bacterium]
MKKGTKKHTVESKNFNLIQMLRGCIKDEFEVSNVKWGGSWNGMNWEKFTFYCTDSELQKIKGFAEKNKFVIELN